MKQESLVPTPLPTPQATPPQTPPSEKELPLVKTPESSLSLTEMSGDVHEHEKIKETGVEIPAATSRVGTPVVTPVNTPPRTTTSSPPASEWVSEAAKMESPKPPNPWGDAELPLEEEKPSPLTEEPFRPKAVEMSVANDEEPEALILPSQQSSARPFKSPPCNPQVSSPVPTVSSGQSTQESSLTLTETETETADRPISEGEVLFSYGQMLAARALAEGGLSLPNLTESLTSTLRDANEMHLIQTSFKYLQGWCLNHSTGQPVPMLDNPFSEVKFPNIQSKPPLAQLEAISSCPITCNLGEETDPHLSTTSFQGVVKSDKVSPQPPFLQAKQPQFPQPLLVRLLLQTLHQLRCPSLHTLQPLNVSLVVKGRKLNTAFEVRPHQCPVQGHDHFPSPAGHTIFDTSQDATGFLGHLGTLLAHIQPAVDQHPQVLLCQAAFQPLFPKPVALHGVAVAQVQDLALGLVEPHTIDLGPSIQPVQVPLQSLPTLQQINTPTQLGVICNLTEGALDPFIQISDKDVKQNWPQHRALGNTTCDRPPTGVNSIHHHSLGAAIQPVLYPARDLTGLEKWADRNLIKFNKGECHVLHPRRSNSMHQYMLGAEQLESTIAEKNLQILVNKLNTDHQYADYDPPSEGQVVRRPDKGYQRDPVLTLLAKLNQAPVAAQEGTCHLEDSDDSVGELSEGQRPRLTRAAERILMGHSVYMDHPTARTSENRPHQGFRSPSPGQLAQIGGTVRLLLLLGDIYLIKEFFSLHFSLSAEILGDADTSRGPMLMAELESQPVSNPVLQAAQPSCRVTSPSEDLSQVNSKDLFCNWSESAN
ncbi:hypothetical protein QYF61_015544 [Mycteria americana]|uniref:Uncharacterized protein n=1 Tax=Mycteria americana TaxID=33587 RepID=A0AAN7N638_MYCAM|nr:hypothetical protein QYF61_015544 [Mycteria americana]